MRRTMEMVRDRCNAVNARLFEKGSSYYYRVNKRCGYKAIDKYRRCDECMSKMGDSIDCTCSHDTLTDTLLAGLSTGQAYDALTVALDALCLLA